MPAKQQAAELRDLNDEDLAKELEESYRELFTTRLQLSTRQLANTSQARKVRTKPFSASRAADSLWNWATISRARRIL